MLNINILLIYLNFKIIKYRYFLQGLGLVLIILDVLNSEKSAAIPTVKKMR